MSFQPCGQNYATASYSIVQELTGSYNGTVSYSLKAIGTVYSGFTNKVNLYEKISGSYELVESNPYSITSVSQSYSFSSSISNTTGLKLELAGDVFKYKGDYIFDGVYIKHDNVELSNSSSNLLTNGTFEQGFNEWTTSTSGLVWNGSSCGGDTAGNLTISITSDAIEGTGSSKVYIGSEPKRKLRDEN